MKKKIKRKLILKCYLRKLLNWYKKKSKRNVENILKKYIEHVQWMKCHKPFASYVCFYKWDLSSCFQCKNILWRNKKNKIRLDFVNVFAILIFYPIITKCLDQYWITLVTCCSTVRNVAHKSPTAVETLAAQIHSILEWHLFNYDWHSNLTDSQRFSETVDVYSTTYAFV